MEMKHLLFIRLNLACPKMGISVLFPEAKFLFYLFLVLLFFNKKQALNDLNSPAQHLVVTHLNQTIVWPSVTDGYPPELKLKLMCGLLVWMRFSM